MLLTRVDIRDMVFTIEVVIIDDLPIASYREGLAGHPPHIGKIAEACIDLLLQRGQLSMKRRDLVGSHRVFSLDRVRSHVNKYEGSPFGEGDLVQPKLLRLEVLDAF